MIRSILSLSSRRSLTDAVDATAIAKKTVHFPSRKRTYVIHLASTPFAGDVHVTYRKTVRPRVDEAL